MKLPFQMAATAELREAAAKVVMAEIGTILNRISSNESGRILETVVQLMPDDVFKTMSYIVIGNESDDTARNLLYEFVFRIANKLGMDFDSIEPINYAAGNALVIVNCESLRRKGQMEYLAPNDIFTDTPKHPGFNTLTDSGKQRLYTEMLEIQPKPKYVM